MLLKPTKNQLFDLSENLDSGHSKGRKNDDFMGPDESFNKNVSSWNGQSFEHEKNEKKNITWTRTFHKTEK